MIEKWLDKYMMKYENWRKKIQFNGAIPMNKIYQMENLRNEIVTGT